MQPADYPFQPETLKRVWQTFVETGRLSQKDLDHLDPAVLQSWRRCLPRLDPRARPRPTTLKERSLSSVLRAQSDLITVARPLMEDVHQFIEGSHCAILLADGTACILEVCGDADAMALVDDLGLGQGTYWAEGQVGTNALGLVRLTAMPTQVVGPEHYFQAYHHLSNAAAPVHDVRGRIIGIIALLGPAEGSNSHGLGLVMGTARAISNQLQTDWYVEEANRRLTEMNTILEAISEGVIAWNEAGKIHHVNAPAGEILQINPTSVLGRSLETTLTLPPAIADAIANNHELHDVETSFAVDGKTVNCLVNLRPIFEGDSHPVGYIAMLRPIEQVRRLVHQQIGVQATINLDDISSQAIAMRPVLRQARIAARGTAPVLLEGEGGVGKNHLARAIHNDSNRADKPFLAINCQAVPHELMASEFLGHEKDGSTSDRPSKFELANGGTLLLDQIETLSLEMQAALHRLIETGHVMRLGSTRPIPLNVRIMAATSASLESRVAGSSFLSHLYYRFGVFHIQIPPLRERTEDIPLLAERFLARITQRQARASWIDDQALAILKRYPWPGNVRELESVLERAINHSRDGIIRAPDLPEVVRNGRIITPASPQPQPILTISDAEREAIIRAGWACSGHVTEMAQQLEISRTTLWRKMKHFNISTDTFKQ